MKFCALGIVILVSGLVAVTPARADFSLIRFADGHCEIWWGAYAAPLSAGWIKLGITPDWWSAQVLRDEALLHGACIL
jgi:hypothetical protein